jgi:hypothetical protein
MVTVPYSQQMILFEFEFFKNSFVKASQRLILLFLVFRHLLHVYLISTCD